LSLFVFGKTIPSFGFQSTCAFGIVSLGFREDDWLEVWRRRNIFDDRASIVINNCPRTATGAEKADLRTVIKTLALTTTGQAHSKTVTCFQPDDW
jgi:hypothetical protein